MKTVKRALLLALAVFMALACSGCMAAGADGLYALPRMSDEYVQLEELIAQRIAEGGEYAAPIGGANRQSLQLHDLDGDGTAEAIAFLADSGHTPTVCIYRANAKGDYHLDVVINGEGSAVSSVEYADITGNGIPEFIVTWQISGNMRLLSVYSMQGEQPTALLSADCSEFTLCDLDGNGVDELMDLVIDYGGTSTLTRYSFDAEGRATATSAQLSKGITEVMRVRAGHLADQHTAMFVESRVGEDELITDVFAASGGAVANITLAAAGRSNTLRPGQAYAADINGDRAMEIPEATGDILNWYTLDLSGRKELAMTTYHSYDNGWYLALTEPMMMSLSVSVRDDIAGESAATFTATAVDGSRERLLTIYTLTGENRLDRANEEGRFILRQDETTVYAAELHVPTLKEKDITENFDLIYPEWQTGAL